jgi:hypothetical protein
VVGSPGHDQGHSPVTVASHFFDECS